MKFHTRRLIVRLIEQDLGPGDHIFVRRNGLLYSHHGIYAGDGNGSDCHYDPAGNFSQLREIEKAQLQETSAVF